MCLFVGVLRYRIQDCITICCILYACINLGKAYIHTQVIVNHCSQLMGFFFKTNRIGITKCMSDFNTIEIAHAITKKNSSYDFNRLRSNKRQTNKITEPKQHRFFFILFKSKQCRIKLT